MSKSLTGGSSCGKGCCSSKSLKNIEGIVGQQINEDAITQIVNQIIGDIDTGAGPGDGGGGGPIEGIPDPLEVNNLVVFQLAQINNALIGGVLDIGNGDLVFENNTITSNSSILVNPAIDFQIDPNLVVNGDYTRLNTTETRITDCVPTIGYINPTGILALDNCDRGFEFNYVTDEGGSFVWNRGFFGYDKDRDRFVSWKRSALTPPASDQNYERLGADLNEFDLDVIYTTEIKNPDYLIGGLPVNDINIVATSGTLNFTSLDQDHDADTINYDVASSEVHNIGAGLAAGEFIVQIPDGTDCKKIELTEQGTPGLYLYHSSFVDIQSCSTGSVINIESNNDLIMKSRREMMISSEQTSIDITAPDGVCVRDVLKVDFIEPCVNDDIVVDTPGGQTIFNNDVEFNGSINITDLEVDADLCIKSGFKLETNEIVESCEFAGNMLIHTSSTRTITIETNNANLTLTAGGSGDVNINALGDNINLNSNVTTVNNGLEFDGATSNPGSNDLRTIWIDTTDSNKLKKEVSGFAEEPFVQSVSTNGSTGRLAVYAGDDNLIDDRPVTVDGSGNIDTNGGDIDTDGGDIITDAGDITTTTGDLSIGGTSTLTGAVTATNVLNSICADQLIIDGACFPIDATLAGGGSNDLGRVMFFQDSTSEVNLSSAYTGAPTPKVLSTINGTTLTWETPAALAGVTLQNAYDASVLATDNPTIELDNSGAGTDTIPLTIEDSRQYANALGPFTIFQVRDLSPGLINYFEIEKVGIRDVEIHIGQSGLVGNGVKMDIGGTTIQFDPNGNIVGSNPINGPTYIARFDGDVDITGVIDPEGIIFQDQGAVAPVTIDAASGNAVLWVDHTGTLPCMFLTGDTNVDREVVTTAPATTEGQALWYESAVGKFSLSDAVAPANNEVLTWDTALVPPKPKWKPVTSVSTVIPYSLVPFKVSVTNPTIGNPTAVAYFLWDDAEYGATYVTAGPRLVWYVDTLGAGFDIEIFNSNLAATESTGAAVAGFNSFALTVTTDPVGGAADAYLEFRVQKSGAGVDPEIFGMSIVFDV